jgi:hypothetical protein
MREFWNSIVSGLTSAVLWAAILWIVNLGRNRWIERQLRSSLSRIGTQSGDEGFGITLKNQTRVPILVRDATFLTNDPEQGIGLVYAGPTSEYLIVERKTRKPMTFKTKTRVRALKGESTPYGFVELPPYTGGIWRLDPSFYLENPDLVPTAARATIEYRTFLGNPKLIIVRSNVPSAGLVRDQYRTFLEYIRKKRQLEETSVRVRQ